jgi:hypothetical protein
MASLQHLRRHRTELRPKWRRKLPIVRQAFKASDPAGDTLAVAAVQEVADIAAAQT